MSSDLVADSAGAQSLLGWASLLIACTCLVVVVYHSMQKPRLGLTPTESGWVARPREIVLYLLTIPILLFVWWVLLAGALTVTPTKLTASGVIAVSGGIVVAVRVLAHIWAEPGHELAKSIPLTLITILIVTQSPNPNLSELADQVADVEVTRTAYGAVLGVELVVTALWYFVGVRYLARRGVSVVGVDPNPQPLSETPGGDTELRLMSRYLIVGFLGALVGIAILDGDVRVAVVLLVAAAIFCGFVFARRMADTRSVKIDATVGLIIPVLMALSALAEHWALTAVIALIGLCVSALLARGIRTPIGWLYRSNDSTDSGNDQVEAESAVGRGSAPSE